MSIACAVSMISSEGLKRVYKFVVSREEKRRVVNERLSKEAVNFSLKGFRPGKVPLSIVYEHCIGRSKEDGNKELKDSIDQDIRDKTFWGYVSDNELNVVPSSPDITYYDAPHDGGVEYEVSLELQPEIPEIDQSSIEVNVYASAYTEQDVEKARSDIMKSKVFDAPDGHQVLQGDLLSVDFVGKIDGVEFNGGTASNFSLKIGSGAVIPGIEEQLVGAIAGEERVVKTVFPEEYHMKEVAGKDVVFDIKVNSIQTYCVELEEYVKKYHAEDGREGFDKSVNDGIDHSFAYMKKIVERKGLFDWLEKNVELEIPESSFKEQKRSMQSGGYNKDDIDDVVRRQVKCNLIMDHYANKMSLEVDQSSIWNMIAMKLRGLDPARQAEILRDNNVMRGLEAEVKGELLREKAAEELIKSASTNEVKISFSDLEEMFKEF